MKRRGGGSKLNRTQVVTVRLDPRLRYLTELASRKQRRTVSSFIEWAIAEAVLRTQVGIDERTLIQEADYLWHIDPDERLRRLAERHPELLTYADEVKLKGAAG